MGFEVIKRSLSGLGFGSIYFFIILTVLNVRAIDVPVSKLWVDMIGCLLIGLYFGISSLIFDIEPWSPLKQTVTHFILSLIVFFPVAIRFGWIPLKTAPLITGFVIFFLLYVLFWFGALLFYKKLRDAMNDSLKK